MYLGVKEHDVFNVFSNGLEKNYIYGESDKTNGTKFLQFAPLWIRVKGTWVYWYSGNFSRWLKLYQIKNCPPNSIKHTHTHTQIHCKM